MGTNFTEPLITEQLGQLLGLAGKILLLNGPMPSLEPFKFQSMSQLTVGRKELMLTFQTFPEITAPFWGLQLSIATFDFPRSS